MGQDVTLRATDGHSLGAYRADPKATPRAGIVVVQEVFGVNAHIRSLVDRWAERGYVAIAPALFDREERDVRLDYDAEGLRQGRALRRALGWDVPLFDVEAARASIASAGRVGVVGFCWGGSVAWLSATRLAVDAAACFYGAQIAQFRDETPRCPVLMHFGERDPLIPATDVAAIRASQPALPIHVYAAGHGFHCDARDDFDRDASRLADDRTRAFFEEHLREG